jgi:ABC-2 type transport system permease protein
VTAITTTETVSDLAPRTAGRAGGSSWVTALGALTRRRLALSARTSREIVTPLLTPVLFALVVAPALADARSGSPNEIDYMTFVALATLGTLIPFSCMSSGMGVIVDRIGGAQRDLLAAPVPRRLIVVANLIVATLLSGVQVVVLVGLAALRGADFDVRATGLTWFVATVVTFGIVMYGVSEVLANVITTQEQYVNTIGAVAFAPWFVAGSLFPISALPVGLTVLAKVMPLTHALAVIQYGLVDPRGAGLHDIWGMSDPAAMAALSLLVLGAFAVVSTVVAVRVFQRTAVH